MADAFPAVRLWSAVTSIIGDCSQLLSHVSAIQEQPLGAESQKHAAAASKFMFRLADRIADPLIRKEIRRRASLQKRWFAQAIKARKKPPVDPFRLGIAVERLQQALDNATLEVGAGRPPFSFAFSSDVSQALDDFRRTLAQLEREDSLKRHLRSRGRKAIKETASLASTVPAATADQTSEASNSQKAPKKYQEEAGDGSLPARINPPVKRPRYDRDHTFLDWKKNLGLTPAKIRDKWNQEHPSESVGRGTAGREVVKKGIAAAERDLKKL